MAIVLNGTTGITTPDIDSTAGFDAADITGTISQSQLAAEAVNEAKMQVSNAPTNGYMLTAQSGDTGGLTWAAAPTSSTTAGAVGTYGIMQMITPNDGTNYNIGPAGTTIAASNIRWINITDSGQVSTSPTISGTWRNMSYGYLTGAQVYTRSLYVRIS